MMASDRSRDAIADALACEHAAESPAAGRRERVSENVRAVSRALDVLLAFTSQDLELSAAELIQRVGLSRPTLYRLLYTLEDKGFVVSVGEPLHFRLGPAVARLAHVWTSSLDLAAIAEPMMRRVAADTGETVALFVPQGRLRLCLAEIPSPQSPSFECGVGYTERIARGASGWAILAWMGLGVESLASYTEGTPIDPSLLADELLQTRDRGYCISRDELIDGAGVAIAAPLFDRNGRVLGSLGVCGPAIRLSPQRQQQCAALVASQAAVLTRALGDRR
jgi:IclR family acetate operon transcriptional repressor